MFSLLSGLSSYLQPDNDNFRKESKDLKNNNEPFHDSSYQNKQYNDQKNRLSNLIFIIMYILSILIIGTTKPLGVTDELYLGWDQVLTSAPMVIQLLASVLLSFFFPGYALIYILLKSHQIGYLPKILLSFLFSILIMGFSTYVAAIILGVPAEYLKPIIIGIEVSVLITFIINIKTKRILSLDLDTATSFFSQKGAIFRMLTAKNMAFFIIFASLFALVVFYTSYIEKGLIVGDQWFHHGRSLLINSGSFKDFAASDAVAGQNSPPFFSALLAGYFNLSGVPSVNAYVSINLLNMMAIFGFYYFFSRWVPSNKRKAAVLATTLFVLSSGFGWLLVLDSSVPSKYYYSEETSLENLHAASIRSSDIRTPVTFINVGHPTFTSPLIIIALPAGFIVLGLIKERIPDISKLRFICVITVITVVGILSHPEFYLFIIVGSILILSFRLMHGNLFYISIISALLLCVFINFLSPQNYYTSIKIFDIPLPYLCLIFLSILLAFYRTRSISKLGGLNYLKHSFPSTGIFNSISKPVASIVIISLIAYMYLFSFIVLQAISTDDVQIQVGTSTQRNIPGYLYPIKFGIAGVLGLAFVVSYLFKRYEKETFVFGIIAIVALFAGPYYDEHRFSKYVMVGMVGFASLFVYKIILYLQRHPNDSTRYNHSGSQLKLVSCSLLIAALVTSAGLSVFMLAGYKALGYNNPQFHEDFFRVDFPSQSELKLLGFFRAELPNLKENFIAIHANDSQTQKIFSELEGFSAIPRHRILQNPQSLNASTLQGLYYTLNNDKIKYLIFLKGDASQEDQFAKPIQFAWNNFPRVYQDDKYVVLKVPVLSPMSSEGDADIGLVYNEENNFPLLSETLNDTNTSNTKIPQYDYKFFDNVDNTSESIKIGKKMTETADGSNSGQTDTLTIYADKKAKTIWSNPIEEQNIVNYVEGKFRLLAENKSKNDVGIRMVDDTNNQLYIVSLDKDSLKIKQRSTIDKNNPERIIAQSQQLPEEQMALWHSLKILVLNSTINVYLDDVLKVKTPKSPFAENFRSVSKIGISANENIVEFEPLKIGYVSESVLESSQKAIMKDTYYHNYYPLSALALAKLKYDTFIDDDLSVFSKKNIILVSDPRLEPDKDSNSTADHNAEQHRDLISEEKYNRFLEFVKSGGTIIVLNHDTPSSNYNKSISEEGVFSKFLSIRFGGEVKFNGILDIEGHKPLKISEHDYFTNISGVARNIEFTNSSNIEVKSYYVDVNMDNRSSNKTVAPFAFEKKYGIGKIVLVNIGGYLDSLFRSNNHLYIMNSLPKMIGLESNNYYDTASKDTIFAGARLKDTIKIFNYSDINIKSSSLLLQYGIHGDVPSYNLTVNSISTSSSIPIIGSTREYNGNLNLNQKQSSETSDIQNIVINNVTIRDLKLFGQYEVIINSTDKFFRILPQSSYYDYTRVVIPNNFDMLIRLGQDAYIEFAINSCKNNNHYCQQHMKISDGIEVNFHKIRVDSQSIPSIPFYLKSPEILIHNGTAKFTVEPNINNLAQPSGNIVANGNILASIDHVEAYDSINNNRIITDFVTHLKSIDIDGNYVGNERQRDILYLPGDISERAKDKGIGVPWQTAMASLISIIGIILIVALAIPLEYYLRHKFRQHRNLKT